MMDLNDLLRKKGLKYEELTLDEQETLNSWMEAVNKTQVNIATVREYVSKMRDGVANALADMDETPNEWISIACLFIPFLGIVRKWYIDQKRVALTARLRNYILLENFLMSPEKAKRAMERALSGLTTGKSR